MKRDEDLFGFVAASFPSVWALELLLTLKAEERGWTQDELVAALRASELVVSNALSALVAAGLASVENGEACYTPVTAEVAACVQQVEQLYRLRPNAIRRAIVTASSSGAAAFADAFRLRKE